MTDDTAHTTSGRGPLSSSGARGTAETNDVSGPQRSTVATLVVTVVATLAVISIAVGFGSVGTAAATNATTPSGGESVTNGAFEPQLNGDLDPNATWYRVGADKQRTGVTDDPGPAVSMKVNWQFEDENVNSGGLTAVGDEFIFGDSREDVVAQAVDLNTRTVTKVFNVEAAEGVARFDTVSAVDESRETVYFSSRSPNFSNPDGVVDAYDLETGAHRWTTDVAGNGGPTVLATGRLFAVDAETNELVALDPDDGSVLWRSAIPTAREDVYGTVFSGVSYVPATEQVVVANNTGGFHFYAADSGVRSSVDVNKGSAIRSYRGSPAVDGEQVYFGWVPAQIGTTGTEGVMAAVNAADEEVVWTNNEDGNGGMVGSPTVADGKVVMPFADFEDRRGGLVAFSTTTGDIVWNADRDINSSLSQNSPVIAGERVLYASANQSASGVETNITGSFVHSVDLDTGAYQSSADLTDGTHQFADPVVIGEQLLVSTGQNGIVAVGSRGLSVFDEDRDAEIDAREVLSLIAAYNNDETVEGRSGAEQIAARDVLQAISAYNNDRDWTNVAT